MLTTGNKSELATGYSTLYGDSAGGFAVIKDVPEDARVPPLPLSQRTCRAGTSSPRPCSSKAPSAELRPDQRDDDSLPPTTCSTPCWRPSSCTTDRSPTSRRDGIDPELVARGRPAGGPAEYKRSQSPPGVRITAKAFGKDRRMPITNRYRDPAPTTVVIADARCPTTAGRCVTLRRASLALGTVPRSPAPPRA